MTKLLRQSTAVKVFLGPLINANTSSSHQPVNTITAAVNDILFVSEGATGAADLSTRTFTSVGAGMLSLSLLAADTATLGGLQIMMSNTSQYRPFGKDFEVLPANIYDSLVNGSDYLQVDALQLNSNAIGAYLNSTSAINADVTKIATNATAAGNMGAAAIAIVTGTASTPNTTTSIKTSLSASVNSTYVGRTMIFTSGTLVGQAQTIASYTGATATVGVAGFTSAPSNGDTFVIL